MADDDKAGADVSEHCCRHIAGKGARTRLVAILPAQADRLDRFGHQTDLRGRRGNRDLHAGVPRGAAIDRARFCQQGTRTVHLPVADNVRPVWHWVFPVCCTAVLHPAGCLAVRRGYALLSKSLRRAGQPDWHTRPHCLQAQ